MNKRFECQCMKKKEGVIKNGEIRGWKKGEWEKNEKFKVYKIWW
jgi:hypothetical protein